MNSFAIAVAALLAASTASAAVLTPDDIARDIQKHGAKAVVDRLWNNNDWERVMDHVDTGDARWIALVPRLAPGTDAGTAEELPIALAFALPRNPEAVLSVIGGKKGLRIADVCSAPFIEDTVPNIPAYIKRAEAAVSRVSDPALARTKTECLEQLKTATMP
jgi:hypothetical protein